MCRNGEKCGSLLLVVGILMFVNVYYWPQLLGIDGWLTFFAVLFMIEGLAQVFAGCRAKKECCTTGTEACCGGHDLKATLQEELVPKSEPVVPKAKPAKKKK